MRIIIIVILFTCNFLSYGQKVGLVLSGGGSKGVSHIGVIRALEEAEIPIDYITGTSMGAIIGGLYAAGYTPDEMEDLFKSREFEYWSTGKLEPQYNYYYKLPAPTPSWLELKFNIDSIFKPLIPTNLISPVMMDFAFMELYASASAAAEYNFDSLFVPFRCVASDISKARPVVLNKGDLGNAIRASMTFPFYFKPIKIDSVLLFDGGMYNNFPSDVMLQDFYPDIIIGSQASSNAEDPKIDDVMSQIENMLMQKSNFNVLCDNSVMIKPNVKDVNVVDFSNTDAFIDSGFVETNRMIPEIRSFITEHRSKQHLDSLRALFNQKKPAIVIGSIQINGLKNEQYQYINQFLNKQSSSLKSINYNDFSSKRTLNMIKPQYYKLVAEGNIGDIYPRLHYFKDEEDYHLTIDIQRQNQLITEIGGAITSSSVNELFLQLKYHIWTSKAIQLRANSYFGRFYNSALAEIRIDVPNFKPHYFIGGFIFNKWNYFETSTFFYADDDPFFLVELERFGFATLGFPVRNTGKFLMDLSFGSNSDRYYQTNTYTSQDKLDKTTFFFVAPGLNFEVSTLNFKEYPNSGSRLSAKGYIITGTEKFFPGTTAPDETIKEIPHTWIYANIEYENYFKSLGKLKLGLYSQFNYSTQKYFSNYTSTLLSATPFLPVPESITRFMPSYRANKFLALGSKNVYRITKNIDCRLEGYVLITKDAIRNDPNSLEISKSKEIHYNPVAAGMLVYRTPIGPLSIDLNYYNDSDQPFSAFVKFGYLIFNRRAF